MTRFGIRDGTSQDERLLPALKAGYVNVDERRFEDLLAMAAEYAGLLQYRDAKNQPHGDWKAFFESDEACILAMLQATSLDRAKADFARFDRDFDARLAAMRGGSMPMETLPHLDLARKINAWFVKLGALSSVAALRAYEKIAHVIEKMLRHELQSLRLFMRRYNEQAVEAAFGGFGQLWWEQEENGARSEAPEAADDRVANRQFLKSNFYAFHNAVLFLQENTAEILQLSLERANHDPALGLYISFLKLFAKAQHSLNGFTQRHLDFYYDEVLKIGRRDFVPDSAHLIFYPDTAGREVAIARGAEFRAGLDDNGNELIYAADDDLLVNDAKVCSLHTMHFERDALSSPENVLCVAGWEQAPARQFATAAKLNRLGGASGNDAANATATAQPLFGAPQHGGRRKLFEEARIGFALASNVLLLKQGQRDVTLTFRFASRSEEASLDRFVGRLGDALSTKNADAFFKAFRHMFRILLTAETGWLEVDEYLPLSHLVDEQGCEANSLKIRIHLPDSAPALVPYAQALHGEDFGTELPVIKFVVNPDAYLYPYDLLREMVVREVAIEAEVRGGTDVRIYNQLGQLSADAQFNPFGPLPVQGNYFIIGSYEAARKKLDNFEVEIEWGGLPQEMNGFEEYYRAYGMQLGNASFKAKLAVLRDRKWMPAKEEEQPEAGLFEAQAVGVEDGKVGRKRRFSFQGLCRLMRPLENVAEEQYGYDAKTKDGFFRLSLAQPQCAFGHKDYPLVLSKVMTENSRLKKFWLFRPFSKAAPPLPTPNPPYTPLISSITVNYRAVANISLERIASSEEERIEESLFHLHPLGLEALSPKAYGKIHLVPQYAADGNLYIGISASKLSGPLTLFFHLREDSLPEAGAQAFEFAWHYLRSNQWVKLGKSQVISDSTNGFLSSGIVMLDIPEDINRANTILPGDQFWLRLSVLEVPPPCEDGMPADPTRPVRQESRIHALCSLYAVHTQALKVSWKRAEGNSLAHLETKLPGGTIKEPRISIPGINGIRQIMDSFGGQSAESREQMTIRASERLKHKNRAVTPWDYERLILQRFPEIYKVKCFPCMGDDVGHERRPRPGHLLIVLIPYPKEPSAINLRPMVNALLLKEVGEFVREMSSGFAGVTVRNPAYEQIQIRCKVRFRKGMAHGLYLNKLNQELVDYLSPWSPVGFEPRFGWTLRCNDVQSHVQRLDYVASVSGLSMLHIVEGRHSSHRLFDTARRHASEIRPTHPWSIAIPVRRHLVEVVDDGRPWPSEVTGVGRLAIGSTFILSRETT